MKLGYGPPDQDLLRELRQVKAAAGAVITSLAETNAVPLDFPRNVLEDICAALSGLEDGTAENCRPTLEYARNKIPEIRREYFHLEGDERAFPSDGGEEPRLYRGMPLDVCLNSLIGSVTTALDEYRVQAQERFDDEVRAEETVVLHDSGETSGVSADATLVIETSNRALDAITAQNVHKTDNGEVLRRRLTDGKNLAIAARSQIRSRRIVRRWFEGIAQALHHLPDLIGRAGRAIKVGSDVADVLSDWWSRTQHEILRAVINQVREFGSALEQISEALRRRPSAFSESPTATELQRAAERLNAEAEVARLLIAGKSIPEDLAELVQTLQLSGSPENKNVIPRWSDLRYCKNLVALSAQSTNFSIEQHGQVLKELRRLEEAGFSDQSQKDVEALGFISGLLTLWLDTDAGDVSALRALSKLRKLKIFADNVEDISGISSLSNLESLSLQANALRNSGPLASLSELRSLVLRGDRVSSVEFLRSLIKLDYLSLDCRQVVDFEPLAVLTELTSLKLQGVKAKKLPWLSPLKRLKSLVLQANFISDVHNIAPLVGLSYLALEANSASRIEEVRGLRNLESLSLQANMVEDFSAVGDLVQLSALALSASRARDLSCLANISELRTLSLQANLITDISFLSNLSGLTSLSLKGANIRRGFTALSSLQSLMRLDVTATEWGWIHALAGLTNLEFLTLSGKGEVDVSSLSELKRLRALAVNSLQVANAEKINDVDFRYS